MHQPRRGTPDFFLLSLTFALVGFGLVMVFSASSATAADEMGDKFYFIKRQLMWAALGTTAMFFFMNVHYSRLKKWFFPFFLAVVFMLIIVLFREQVNGAKSWFLIGSFGIQPAEFAKLAVIMYLAALISKKGDKIRSFKKGLLPVLTIIAFVTGLIMLQPDMGTCMILVMCSALVIVAGGARFKHLMVIGGAATVAVSFLIMIKLLTGSYDYRMARLTSFLDPWVDPLGSGYQLIQSLYAFGHGGLTGAGFGQSIQKLHYLDFAYNDFIFAIIGEELGFIGTTLFLLVYLLFLWRGLIVVMRSSDTFAMLLGTGIVSMFGIQALINIGGVSGSIPLTGVTLPLISYGGSSLLVSMVSIGILLNISRENNKPDKSRKM